jgi:hypothetical protein
MFQTPQNNSISHFSIGGIHGLPYVEWEGAGGANPVKGSQWGGYCTHGCVLFPTWHRPYVALYEVSSPSYAFRTSLSHFMLISIILSSKCCSRTLSRLQTLTRWIHRVGLPRPRTCERHTGTGRLTLFLLHKLSLCRPSISSHPMDKRPPWRTHSSNTPSTPLTPLSRRHTAVGKRRSGTPMTLTALTRPRTFKPSQRKASLFRLTYAQS